MALPTIEREVAMGRYHAPAAAGDAALASLVFVHDVWGPSPHSRDVSKDLAGEGFGVLEIDLYRDMGAVEIEAPGSFIRGLSDPAILADLDAGADWLRRETSARDKVGIMGVCMGGTYALLAACLSDRFAAAAPFYGILSYERGMLATAGDRDSAKKPHSPLEVAARLRMPLLAAFGEDDEFVPVDDVRELEKRLGGSRKPAQVDLYAGAGHAFLNRTRDAAYRPDASAAAWSKLIPFLRRELSA